MRKALILCLFCAVFPVHATPLDIPFAPPAFLIGTKRVVPIDFQKMDLELRFDPIKKTASGYSKITFKTGEGGYPLFDFVPNIQSAVLDGTKLNLTEIGVIKDPDKVTTLRMIDVALSKNTQHALEIGYEIPSNKITYTDSGVRIGFFMTDLGDRGFLEQFAPSNLEFDAFSMNLKVIVLGNGKTRLFTNGSLKELGTGDWEINFPEYFTTSSFYLHLTDAPMTVINSTFQGMNREVPITVYAASSVTADNGMTQAKSTLKELEATYGPYAHERVVIYVTAGGGGMEYCGATTTSLSAIGHELTHSWFARGVMPANGNAGWIDEAIASWRDDEYPSNAPTLGRPPANLAGFAPYRRSTPIAAYDQGMRFLSELDYTFKSMGGLKVALRPLFADRKKQLITTGFFQKFLEDFSGKNLSQTFSKYVYGKSLNVPSFLGLAPLMLEEINIRIPRRYTEQELVEMR